MAYRNYSTANSHIVDQNGLGDFTTITTALAAAAAGETIFVRDGTYTESFTLVSGVNVTAFEGDGLSSGVTVSGKITCGTAQCTVSGITINNPSDYFISAAGICNVSFIDCFFNVNGHDGVNITGAANIRFFSCLGNHATSNAFFVVTNTSTSQIFNGLRFEYCSIANSSGTASASTISGGQLISNFCEFYFPITSSGTAATSFTSTKVDGSLHNQTGLTIGGSGTNSMNGGSITSGTASALSVGSALTATNIAVSSSNTNAITGAGNLSYGLIAFTGSSSGVNTSTLTALATLV